MTTLIAYISLLVGALVGLCAMLRLDVLAHQRYGHSNSRFYAWLTQSGELTSPKRLLILAVLIGCFTTMAQQSWMVIMVLAVVLLAQGVVLFFAKREGPAKLNKRTALMFLVALAIASIVIGGIGYLSHITGEANPTQSAALTAIIVLAVSPLITMLSGWLLKPVLKKAENPQENAKTDN